MRMAEKGFHQRHIGPGCIYKADNATDGGRDLGTQSAQKGLQNYSNQPRSPQNPETSAKRKKPANITKIPSQDTNHEQFLMYVADFCASGYE